MELEKIGRYEIKSELGRGGMATVFHAYDPSFERDVAIKVLPHAFLHDPQFRTRFEREAKMIALLEHPAIVPVYDFGDQDEQPYIVMRYMAGGSLADRLNQGPISLDETARIITRLAPALDAAHARGIIHRDLKPGNVLFDQYGNAFLSDFGIARLTQQGSATLTGEAIVGTPTYMSPEQIQGDKKMDGRSDIYALGVLVFQMLTGMAPYRSDTPAKVMMMHVLEPVPHILERRNDLPVACENVIASAMAKDPDDRFSTTAEMATALDAAARGDELSQPTQISQSVQTMVAAPKPHLDTGGGASVRSPSRPSLTPPPSSQAKRRSPLVWLALAAVVILGGGAVILGGLAYLGRQGTGPLAILAPSTATWTPVPSFTPLPPTHTSTPIPPTSIPVAMADTATPVPPTIAPTETPIPPTETITPTSAPTLPVIGGADKIAYVSDGNIWLANMDGSDLKQMTEDGAAKTNLKWTPDGKAITYILGKCVQSLDVESGRIDILACFNFVDYLEAFEISPGGDQVAISLDHQLYILPYDVPSLDQVKTRTDLTALATCKELAPYQRNLVKTVRWSNDGTLLAADVLGVLPGNQRADIIQVLDVSSCTAEPHILDNFPPPRFTIKGYDKNPVLQNFAWDGNYLFAMNSIVRNDGFGDLYIYNMDLHKARLEINPVDNVCCYRDPQWSPDGSYLMVAFQNYLGGSNSTTQLYYIPYGSIGTGAQYTPLPLPDITNPREKPQPILRPASGGN